MTYKNRDFDFKRCAAVPGGARFCIGFLVVVALGVLLVQYIVYPGASTTYAAVNRIVIVIDPGHGGNDHGVAPAHGLSEKDVMLAIANRVGGYLTSEYEVRLTRTGNYNMDAKMRTSIANNHGADLFISLHAGGSGSSRVNLWTVYHHRLITNDSDFPGNEKAPFFWHQLQQRHIPSAVGLAGKIAGRLEAGSAGQQVHVTGAPLSVLSAANMPALLIETGYLTHPPTARKFSETDYLESVAKDIAQGIMDFFGD